MTRHLDPRRDLAWRTLAASLLLTTGAALLAARAADVTGLHAVAVAVTWAAAWVLAARFRLLAARRRRAWVVVLVAAAVGTVSGNEGLRIVGLILGVLFMLRRQDGLQLLSSRRRMLVFLLGGPLLILTFLGGFGRPAGLAGEVVVFCRTGAQVFWLAALQTLLIGMRLHFLRLRPKLLVAGVLVGVIPLLLLAVFGMVLLYGTLGGSRANRARDVLLDAVPTYHQGRLPDVFSASPRAWSERQPDQGLPWAADLVAALRRHRQGAGGLVARGGSRQSDDDSAAGAFQVEFDDDARRAIDAVAAAVDTVAWVRTDAGYWLVRWRDPGPGLAAVEAIALDQAALRRLARAVRADVQVRSNVGGGTIQIRDGEGLPADLASRYEEGRADPAGGWLRRPRYFGTTMVAALHLNEQRLSRGSIWLALQTSLTDLGREFASTEAALNMVILIVLGVIAIIFFATALTAFIFSLRITGGITGAVKALHRGTQRLAAGDLDVVIELENEDEFGDLAESFNTMTVAVRQGREDALARERLQQEMQTARQIQERLLPREAPSPAGWQLTGVSLPSLQVGGDYFDFLQLTPARLGLGIGDVSGKGVPAALLMSNLQASLKGQVLHDLPVSEVLARINRLLATSTDPHMFATFIYGELDTASGAFVYANAGHEPPLLVRRDGSVAWLRGGGLLLGMFADQRYEAVTVELAPGDVLVLFTDGITEAGAPNPALDRDRDADADEDGAGGTRRGDADREQDVDDREFGEDRLAEVVQRARGRSALGIREAILAAVHAHLAGRPPGDDITLVVVKRIEA